MESESATPSESLETDEYLLGQGLSEIPEIDIFISYRVRPDEDLAGALKTLLESAIEPKPRVFVSGLGGLRASADSYREQLRLAVTRAKTYAGLITKASVEREWIFFEAGAAFGRGVLYAPVLVDIAASELPSSIGGYQGVMAKDQARMLDCVKDIARAIGSQVRSQFAKRYSPFAKAVEAYGKNESVQELSGVQRAISLVELGRREEGEQLFDKLVEAADSAEAKAHIRINKLVSLKENDEELLELLEKQPNEVKSTAVFKLWLGTIETNPIRAIQLLRESFAGDIDGFPRRFALAELVENEFQMGHAHEATKRLLEALSSEDRYLRGDAAALLATHLGDNPIRKLLLLIEATLDSSFDHLLDAMRFCWEKNYIAVGLHLAGKCISKKENEDSHLYRGLLRGQAGLHSLEFEDYRMAAKYGASVAKSNMANLLNSGPVAAAGLEILRDHVGDYNSSDPGGPYAIRAKLERSVNKEQKVEAEFRLYGEQIAKAMHRLLEGWRQSQGNPPIEDGKWQAQGNVGSLNLTVVNGNATIELQDKVLTVQEILPFKGFYVAFKDSEVCLLFIIHNEIEMVALNNGMSKPGKVEWLELTKSEPRMLEASPDTDVTLDIPSTTLHTEVPQ